MVSGSDRRGRDAYRWFMTIATRWADNDAYGHVNNTVYYQWFDTAVNAWLIEAGLLDIGNGGPIGAELSSNATGRNRLRPKLKPPPGDGRWLQG